MPNTFSRSLYRLVFCAVALLSSQLVFAQALPKPLDQYREAWLESNVDSRAGIIASFWTEESIYEDPRDYAKGRIAFKNIIDKFWKGFPGASFEMGTVLSRGNFHTWGWKLFDNKKKLIVAGVDYAEVNGQDQMLHLVGFWYPQGDAAVESNAKVVERYYQSLFKNQDFETIEKITSKDAVYHQAVGLPYGGNYKGFAEWVKMYAKVANYFELQIEKEPQYFTNDSKNEVVIQFTIQCTSKKTGEKISMPISEQFELRDNKIVAIRPFYFDTYSFTAFLEK